MDRSRSISVSHCQDGTASGRSESSTRPEHARTMPSAAPDASSWDQPAYLSASNLRLCAVPYQAPPRFQPQNPQLSLPVIHNTAETLSHQSLPSLSFHTNGSSDMRCSDLTQSHQRNAGDQNLQRGSYQAVGQNMLMQSHVADRGILAPAFIPMMHGPMHPVFLGGPNLGFTFDDFQGHRLVTSDAGSEGGSICPSSTYGETSISQVPSSNSSHSSPRSLHSMTGNVSMPQQAPGITCRIPTRPTNPTFYLDYLRFCATYGKENVVHMHNTLDAQFYHPFSWTVEADPFEARYDEKTLPSNTFYETAFIPAKSTVIIVVGFSNGGADSGYTASLQPEIGQRLISFPILANTSIRPHQETQVPSKTESSKSSSHRNPGSALSLYVVLNGIRQGMHVAIPEDYWRMLTVREKLILATRLSTRRRDKLAGLDFLYAADKLEESSSKLQNAERVATALKEAHARLDAYAFERGSAGGQRECIRIIDFLGGKTTFYGLRWLGFQPCADAFYLCVA